MRDQVDLLVIGGGINGVGIARDAAGRGLSVLLCERGDLASATSSASSKMIHGGLRYLEQYAFRLVRESLAEREVLLRLAPHLIRPRRFVLPHDKGLRPRWMIRAGLFLYDRLGGRSSLPRSRAVRFSGDPLGEALQDSIASGFVYSDCCVDDARLVIVNARDAVRRGAGIATRTALETARRDDGWWRAVLRSTEGGRREVEARALVNAAGPWVVEVLRRVGLVSRLMLRLVKGSHIVVPRLYDGQQAYLLQNDDGRVVFVVPYERGFTLIGTTELPFAGDPAAVQILPQEADYLCRAVSRHFRRKVRAEDAVWSYAGVRPLLDDDAPDPSAVSRDYAFDLDKDGPPVLSIFGGKLTTYRRLAENALTRLAPYFGGLAPAWTASAPLPGAEGWPAGGAAALAEALQRDYPFLAQSMAERLARSYGTEACRLLGDARGRSDLGEDFGHGLTGREVDWLTAEEWVRSADDILWRRTKLGLRATSKTAAALTRYLRERAATRATARPS